MIRRAAVLLVALLILGGDAALVQAVAWTSMLASRSAARGWDGAVASTFSGDEPCAMCCMAKRLREQPKPAVRDGPKPVKAMAAAAPQPGPATAAPVATVPALAVARQPDGSAPQPAPPPPRRC